MVSNFDLNRTALNNQMMGLSTDTKPTTGVLPNSLFWELDTNGMYYFDGTEWQSIGGSGGGGGGLCTVTSGTLDKSYNDLLGMLNNGVIPYFINTSDANTYGIYVLTDLMIDGDYFADWYCKYLNNTANSSNASADGYLSFG